MYTWVSLKSAADLSLLEQYVSPEYGPIAVAKKLTACISDAVKGLLIERNYVDKDYRSTYYNFYAKKGQQYRPNCVRIHFFDGTVTFADKTLEFRCPEGSEHLSDHYYGAHAACWSILRHYSERYNLYQEFLTHDITLMAHQFDPGGLVPSKGLEVSHAERVFQEAETYPVHVARNGTAQNDPSFYRQLLAYVESGFPLFSAMHDRGHAVAVVGYGWRTPLNTAVPGVRYAWDEVQTLAPLLSHY
jgi:hypothetical protein